MLDIGWTEILVIAVVLIVVVGPKDLPPMIRAFGKMTKRLRQTAGEFRAQFDEALREAELDDLKKSVDDIRALNPANSIRETLNPLRQMGQDIKADLERSTRLDSKKPTQSDMPTITAAEDGHSILPDLPTGLGEPPEALRPAAPAPATPAPAPVATAPAAVQSAVAPAASAPASIAPAPKKPAAKKAPVAKSAAASAAKPATDTAAAAKPRKASTAAPAQKAAPKPVAKPAAKSAAKPAARPRKTKTEDQA